MYTFQDNIRKTRLSKQNDSLPVVQTLIDLASALSFHQSFFIIFFLFLSHSLLLMICCLLWTSSKTFKVISTSVLLCPGALAEAASASGAHYVGYWSSRCPWSCASLETTQNNSATQPGMLSKAGVENEIKFVCVSLGINLN